jgi:TonB family protein
VLKCPRHRRICELDRNWPAENSLIPRNFPQAAGPERAKDTVDSHLRLAPHLPSLRAEAEAMLHLDEIRPGSPRLPRSRSAVLAPVVLSIVTHATLITGVIYSAHFAAHPGAPDNTQTEASDTHRPAETRRLVYVARNPTSNLNARGGGGGGNRQSGPIRRAQGIGSDAITLRIAKPLAISASPADSPSPPGLVLDAKPLASGLFDQIGLPLGEDPGGPSTGSGSGGGVGTGVGTGIGSGSGPGIGPGSGGGSGGGIYRPGGGVTPPRVIHQVKPTYTSAALLAKIQGTVMLQLVVDRDGRPTQVHVLRSLDSQGLDEQAILAVSQWRFEPGRLAGTPVDVLVTVALDFWIH